MDRQKMIEEIQEKIADKYKKYIEGCQAFSDICGVKGDDGKYKCQYCRRWNGQDRYVDYYYTVSLSRVLSALHTISYDYCFYDAFISFEMSVRHSSNIRSICPRKLLKEDGSDAYLGDQSDETIQALHGLLVR